MAVDHTAGRVFISTYNVGPGGAASRVLVVDTCSGLLVRTVSLRGPSIALAADERRGRVFVATVGPFVTHTTVTRSHGVVTGFMIHETPVGPGAVLLLDARSGRALRSVAVGFVPAALSIDDRDGRVYVMNAGALEPLFTPPGSSLTAPGSVSVLDANSGAVRRTTLLSRGLSMMALDERTERILVVDNGGSVPSPDAWGWLPASLRRRLPFVPSSPRPRVVPPSVTMLDASR